MRYEVISDVLTVKRLRLRTVKERGVCIAGDGEPLLDGIEQLPDDLLCVGTTYQPISVPVLDGGRVALTVCNGYLLRRIAGDDDEGRVVKPVVGDELLQMELRNALWIPRKF